ncbi:MAG: glycine zipper 2TM domain-containing protein [Alphaproteobacteria bacterium]|nr:glycine zipper 2TM domain-containing protein [Alphaproteobacteria bacterium]
MRIAATLLLTGSLLATAACESVQNNPKQTGGAILGGIAGGVLGSQIGGGTGRTVAIIGGTLLGGLLGSEIGKSLDKADQAYMKSAEQKAYTAPVGQNIAWNNPDSGHYGSVTPTREGRDTVTGAACREYKTAVNVDGRQETATGTACQQSDGSWKVVN